MIVRVQGHCANIFVGSELKQQKADIVDETDRTMQDGHYIDQVALDVDYVNYVRETVPKTISVSYTHLTLPTKRIV